MPEPATSCAPRRSRAGWSPRTRPARPTRSAECTDPGCRWRPFSSCRPCTRGCSTAPTSRPNRSRAGLRVRYRVGGVPYDDVVGVTRPNTGLLRPWSISGPPGGYVQVVSDSLPTAKIAGATVNTVPSSRGLARRGAGDMFVPPGVYTVTGAQSALWESTPVRLVIAGDLNRFSDSARTRVELSLSVKPTVVDEV